jgi:hypothetical protein
MEVRMRKKLLAAVTCGAAVLALGGNAAFAGEVKGPPGAGNVTPKEVNGRSICAYSGLNDYIHGPTNFHVQSYGQDVRDGRENPREFNPGDACNPNAEG